MFTSLTFILFMYNNCGEGFQAAKYLDETSNLSSKVNQCDGLSDGTQQIDPLNYYTSSESANCTPYKKKRSCESGQWTEWTNKNLTITTCNIVAQYCDGFANDYVQTNPKNYYIAAKDKTCTPMKKQRICKNGTWTEWSNNNLTITNCTIQAETCNGFANDHVQTDPKNYYIEATDKTCTPMKKQRTCKDGIWTDWTNNNLTITNCTIQAETCDSYANDYVQTDPKNYYIAATDKTCTPMKKQRTCKNGTWTDWTNKNLTITFCVVTTVNSNDRKASLLESPWKIGFGRNATGAGYNGKLYVVTNTNDSGPGSLRFGLSQKNTWVTYDPSLEGKNIYIKSSLRPAANITWDGRDALVRIVPDPSVGNNLTMIRFYESNAIVHRVIYGPLQRQTPGGKAYTGILVSEGQDYWFDHIESSNLQDDSFGIGNGGTKAAINVTVTHYKVYQAGKGLLIAQDKLVGQNAGRHGKVTVAYSDLSASCRNFRLSGGNYAHGFNNYVHGFGYDLCGNVASHGSKPNRTGTATPVLIAESSVYDDNNIGLAGDTVDVDTPTPMKIQGYVFTDGQNIFLGQSGKNKFVFEPGSSPSANVKQPTIPYSYNKLKTSTVRKYVIDNAGVNGANIFYNYNKK